MNERSEQSSEIEVERWWAEMCKRYGQDPGDPDAFWNVGPEKLAARCADFKAQFGTELVTAETYF
jgi:hypothetical protein